MQLRTLEEVLAWSLAQRADLVDIVVQDEFTHDVVIREAGRYHVFDTT